MNIVLIILSLFFFFSFPVQAFSQQTSLGVSPAIVEEVLFPGEEKIISVFVFNTTDLPLAVKAKAESFAVREYVSQSAKKTFDASSWIKIVPADFILLPHKPQKVEIAVDVPFKAEPGGHYATVYFQPLVAANHTLSKDTYLVARVGVLTFLTVRGQIVQQAELGDLQTASLSQVGPQSFSLAFHNQGNIHLLPSGEVVIKNFMGKEMERVRFSPQIVLPGTKRDLEVRWEKRFLLGRFSAQAHISYGSKNVELESQPISFWIIPWLPLAVLTSMIGLCIVLRRRLILALKILFKGV